MSTPSSGGGYQDIYAKTGVEFNTPDPRLGELREIGLERRWLRIAEAVGFDDFVAIWRILDEANLDLEPGSREQTRIYVPLFSRYLKFQRNRYIETLQAKGLDAVEIRRKIKDELSENLSLRHINRIMTRGNIRS